MKYLIVLCIDDGAVVVKEDSVGCRMLVVMMSCHCGCGGRSMLIL